MLFFSEKRLEVLRGQINLTPSLSGLSLPNRHGCSSTAPISPPSSNIILNNTPALLFPSHIFESPSCIYSVPYNFWVLASLQAAREPLPSDLKLVVLVRHLPHSSQWTYRAYDDCEPSLIALFEFFFTGHIHALFRQKQLLFAYESGLHLADLQNLPCCQSTHLPHAQGRPSPQITDSNRVVFFLLHQDIPPRQPIILPLQMDKLHP